MWLIEKFFTIIVLNTNASFCNVEIVLIIFILKEDVEYEY